jgi:hypothetical protein
MARDDMALPPFSPPGDKTGDEEDWDALLNQVRLEQFDTPAAAHTAAVLGTVLRHPGAVEPPDVVEVKLAVVRVLADCGDARGLTIKEIYFRLRNQWPPGAVRDAALGLVRAGTVTRARKGQTRLLPTLQAALALALSPTLADVRGHRRLLELFDRLSAQATLDATNDDLLAGLVRLRQQVSIYTLDARRVCRDGELGEILAHTEVDETELKQRFEWVSTAVSGRSALIDALAGLNTAVYDYIDAQSDLVARLFASRVRLADPRLLSPEEYRRTAKHATPDQLATVFDGVLFDQFLVWLDPEAIEAAVADIVGTRPPERIPEAGGRHGRRHERPTLLDAWRLNADQLLAGRGEVDLLDHLLTQPWPGPAVTTAELVALAVADRRYQLDRSDALVVTCRDDPRRASAVTPSVLRFTAPVRLPAVAPDTAEEGKATS